MTRRIMALLLLFLVFGAAGWFTWQGLLRATRIDSELQQRIAASSISLAYVLEKRDWLSFSVEPGTRHIRLVTNANFVPPLSAQPQDAWNYALVLELLDAQGNVLQAREYHQRATVTRYLERKSGKELTPSFYLKGDRVPADGKVFVLNLSSYARVATLRVRLGASDPAIESVVLRAYAPQKVAPHKLAHQWQRLTEQDKKQAARGNVYGHELLLQSEITNLLREREIPLAPSGIRGRSYQTRTLYVMRELEGRIVDTPIPPPGVWVDHDLRGVVPIPEQGGQVRLELAATGIGPAPAPGAPVQVRWIGRGPLERASRQASWTGSPLVIQQAWKGGLLEISAPGQLAVRAYLKTREGEQEITPAPMYARAFVADATEPVAYAIEHIGTAATPFRVDLRHFAAEPANDGTASPPLVSYEFLDRAGRRLRGGRILIDPPATAYERLAGDVSGLRASDPSTYYFSLPSEVAQVRFLADKRILVTAYNRPLDLAHVTQVPEDAYVAQDDAFRQPAWFLMRPLDYERLLLDNRSILLILQSRPAEDQPDLLAGRYVWEDYHPEGNWLARHLFTPEQDVGRLREAARPSIYRPVIPGRDQAISLSGVGGEGSVSPTLLVLSQAVKPFQVSISLDGHLLHTATVAANTNEIPLPAVATGVHQFRLDGPAGARYYLNYAGQAKGSLLRRLSNRFDGRALSFVYDRRTTCEETLSMRLHVPHGTKLRSQVSASVTLPADRLIGPLRGWTFGVRHYDIRPDPTLQVPVSGTAGQVLDRGQSFFIPLGEGLPAGRYRFEFHLEQGVPGYLSFSKITPGVVEQRRITIEQDRRHVSITE